MPRGALSENKEAIRKKVAEANRVSIASCYLKVVKGASNGVIIIEANTAKEVKKLYD